MDEGKEKENKSLKESQSPGVADILKQSKPTTKIHGVRMPC